MAFNVSKLLILSTAKHLKYSMKYADLKCGDLKKHRICYECWICIKFLQYITKAIFLMIVQFKLLEC